MDENTNEQQGGDAFLAALRGDEAPAQEAEATGTEEQAESSFVEQMFEAEDTGEGSDNKVPYTRFKNVIDQKNEAIAQVEQLQQQVQTLESESGESNELYTTFLEMYKDFKEPAETLRKDAQLADAFAKLYEAGDDTIAQAFEKISQFVKEGKVEKMPTNKPEAKQTPEDSRLNRLLSNQWKSEVDGILKSSPIRKELHSIIRNGILDNININDDPSQSTIVEVAKQLIQEEGWTQEFLTGKASSAETPPSVNKGGGSTTPLASGQSEAGSEKGEPKTRQELADILREQFTKGLSDA